MCIPFSTYFVSNVEQWQCIFRITLFSFIVWTKSKIVSTEFLFILMHDIQFWKLIWGGGNKARGSPIAPNIIVSALQQKVFVLDRKD